LQRRRSQVPVRPATGLGPGLRGCRASFPLAAAVARFHRHQSREPLNEMRSSGTICAPSRVRWSNRTSPHQIAGAENRPEGQALKTGSQRTGTRPTNQRERQWKQAPHEWALRIWLPDAPQETRTKKRAEKESAPVGSWRRNRAGATIEMLTQFSNLITVPRLAAPNLKLATERLASIGAVHSALAKVVELASRSARWAVGVVRLNYR
jgi:hypothetical protein